MKSRVALFGASSALIIALLGSGCVQMPTERQGISDMRPKISFKAVNERALGARVQINGLDVGTVSDYIDGQSAVRIGPGTHRLVVSIGSDVLLDENIYLGDGVNRAFIVK